ncbi:MAG: hypothetical protein GOMPHAMPRED_004554 [Gomphillus americanus]|uniref:Histidinol-phosphatase n=1 Tax=Gomphillus americanus TaxID=1940652 RepID=A0A8H3FL13_9LECA|nr:MAG: hypothetical protein GOMPHAMPRED_004554 [Gomphillus americanus]
MPYSHHSHSGEFCNHATGGLEEIIQEAIRQGMEMLAMTEHMPRNYEADLYPGESESGWSIPEQATIFDNFYHKARELQSKYQVAEVELLVGMEIDWIRPDGSRDWIERLLSKYPLDFFVGSVHHVHGIPIDYDQEHYDRAARRSLEQRASEESVFMAEQLLFEDYFDDQYDMLRALKPPVVGHFDLIRLLSKSKDASWEVHPRVWNKIERNLQYIRSYDGALELNSAGLRKGMQEPYPKLEICQYFNKLGGKFVLSDDSHGIAHVGHSYEGVLSHARLAHIEHLTVFLHSQHTDGQDQRFPNTVTKSVTVNGVAASRFWRGKTV